MIVASALAASVLLYKKFFENIHAIVTTGRQGQGSSILDDDDDDDDRNELLSNLETAKEVLKMRPPRAPKKISELLNKLESHVSLCDREIKDRQRTKFRYGEFCC
jgi:hypothetical protein